jgi:hypothetical protein
MLSPTQKEEFIDRIIAENSRQLLSIAREFAPPDEVMDLYQDFLYELWESLDRFEGRPIGKISGLFLKSAFASYDKCGLCKLSGSHLAVHTSAIRSY